MTDSPCDLCPERASIHYVDGKFCFTHDDELRVWEKAVQDAATVAAGGPFPTVCPRRAEVGMSLPGDTGEDRWEYGHGLVSGGTKVLTCSYCGSVHPDEFMARLQEGWVLEPTDKAYKAYLAEPDGHTVGKFYFQHLSDEQRTQFVDMVNGDRISFGFPGHFTVLPFFAKRNPAG